MAKHRKYKLSWKHSTSDQVVGYRLYWSKENTISYDSNFIELGDVCEAVLPDIFEYPPSDSDSLRFGISAVDTDGNESDIALLSQTYQAAAPVAPSGFTIEAIDDYWVSESKDEASNKTEDEQLEALAGMAERLKRSIQQKSNVKHYDDVKSSDWRSKDNCL